jgi:trehalose/maltose hydrolase-like predicted phosphorylase
MYSIEKVMPVDEWCDNTATKCGDIGVDNAVQTNAVAVVSLQLATQVGDMFGFDVDPEWEIIAKKIKINFNSTTQTHIQWDNGNRFIRENKLDLMNFSFFDPITAQLYLSRR